ncbi:hypothetical protein [Janthinobacterium sp. GW458P]|uniref:hypothetical protein n=1 Tax=Janthinobacterium sp. GW458P TaxID=1981504 RepID=UPI00111EE534|nr:hypothetical protein [Janthinobacterium sp. GW458P]MBE3025116.1 hypothetical protein [Janthinobacterium sp. GW458P]
MWKVQRGDPHNGGKPYAIVESKASKVGTAPKNASCKPGVKNKLMDNARRIKDAALPKSEDLLEPDTSEGEPNGPPVPTGGTPWQTGRCRSKTKGKHASNKSAGSIEHRNIERNYCTDESRLDCEEHQERRWT